MNIFIKSYFFYFVLLFFIHEKYLPNILGLIWFLVYLFFSLRGFYTFITKQSDYPKNEILFGLIGCLITGLGSYWIASLELGVWR